MEGKISEVIEASQAGYANHMRNIRLLEKVYNSSDFDDFLQCFLRILEGVIQADFQNSSVKCLLQFLAKFASHIATVNNVEENDNEEDPPAHPFLKAVLQRVIKYHDEPATECRYNTCVFLSETLHSLGDEAVVDGGIIDLIQDAMLENIKDSKPLVRLQAVIALTRLQDPYNCECPVIQAYVNSLRDSNHLVRREVVKRIAPNALTISGLKEKTRDPNANVRCAVFTHLADIGVKNFKIVHRQFILKSGFTETNPQVKKTFLEYLLPKWLTSLNSSYLDFLKAIKLDADETDIINTEELSSKIMQVFFKTEPINNLIDALPLDEAKIIPENQVRSELAHYWNIVVRYLRQDEDLEEFLDRIIPELTIFCNYIDRLVTNKFSKTMEDWEYLDFQYLLFHLFDMAEHFDLSEEAGRRALDNLSKTILRKHRLQPRLLNKIVQIGSKLASNVNCFTNEICLIISDIWQPIIEHIPNQQERRERDFKLDQLSSKLTILRGDQEDAVFAQDFQKAHELKTQVEECKKKLEELQAASAPVEQARVSVDDPETLCWCLDLLAALLVHGNFKTLSPSLVTCREEFLMPLLTSKNVEIGWRAFKCLAAYCIFDRKLAEEQLKTLCVPIASYRIIPNFNKTVLLDSIGVVTDLIRLYGTDLFNTEDDPRPTHNSTRRRLYTEDVDDVDSINNNPLTVDFIVSVLLDMLDDENDDIKDAAATAVAKLILNGFPVNSMVVTRIILKWYNPVTTKTLQQKLGMVIKAYSERMPNSREIVAKSIVPILTNIADAPRTSPLAEIDSENVIRFLAAITDSENANGLMHVHTELARILIKEISSRPVQIVAIYFAKMLNLLNIPPDDSPAVKELVTNTELILEKESLDKVSKLQLAKFIAKLSEPINSTVDSTITTGTTSANESGDRTSESRRNATAPARRLSAVIEDDSEVEDQRNSRNAPDEEVPSKKRRIDSGDDGARTSGSNNEETDTTGEERSRTSGHAQEFVGSAVVIAPPAAEKAQSSNSSGSDVIPSSQPNSQLALRRTRMRTRLGESTANSERVAEKDVGVERMVGRKSTSTSSGQSESPVTPEQAQSDSQGKAKGIPKRNPKKGRKRVDNGKIVEKALDTRRKLRSSDTDQSSTPSSDRAESTESSSLRTSSSQERITRSARRNARNGAKNLESNETGGKEVTNRVSPVITGTSTDRESNRSRSAASVEQSPISSNTTNSSFRGEVRRSTRRNVLENNKNSAVSQDITRTSTGSESNRSRSSASLEQLSNSSSTTNSSFQAEVRRSLRRNVLEKNKNSAAISGISKEQVQRKSARSNGRTLSSSSRDSSTESGVSIRSTRSANKRPAVDEGNKKNTRMNGALQKENNNRLAKKATRERLDVDKDKNRGCLIRKSARKKLMEAQEDNIVQGNELLIRVNAAREPETASKTPQVKRKKSRRSKTVLEDSANTTTDQTLHTIVEPSGFRQSLLPDDSPQNTPNMMSSRRLRVVVSETSSDESPTRSIRKSNRRAKKKSFHGFA